MSVVRSLSCGTGCMTAAPAVAAPFAVEERSSVARSSSVYQAYLVWFLQITSSSADTADRVASRCIALVARHQVSNRSP